MGDMCMRIRKMESFEIYLEIAGQGAIESFNPTGTLPCEVSDLEVLFPWMVIHELAVPWFPSSEIGL